jgi:AbrB family looped-hinge helix DNA binding protein
MEKGEIPMKKTEYSRKVDTNGRVIIPSTLRDELDIRVGDQLEFFIHEHEGRTYLCVECFHLEDEIEKAKRILREAGIKID